MSNGVNQCAACGDLWDDDEPHVACRSDHGHDPTDEAVALLKSIGLDITYTDEGLRVVARRIMSIGGEDEQNRQYAAQSKNWTAGYEQGVSDERERAAERVAAALAGQHKAEQYDYPREGQTTLYCRSCADLCHSETGLMCEFPHDGAWPCEGYEDGLKLVAAARGGDA